jgi:hypothetical protein
MSTAGSMGIGPLPPAESREQQRMFAGGVAQRLLDVRIRVTALRDVKVLGLFDGNVGFTS